MLYRLFLLIGLVATTSPAWVLAQSTERVGLMVSLQTIDQAPEPLPYYAGAPDSLAAPRYRTLLLTHAGDSVRLAGDGAGLFIPRTDSIWQAGVKRSVYNDWVEDFVWAAPLGHSPDYTGIDAFNGEYCRGHRTHRITYAGPYYLALRQRSSGYCEGATHPWTYHTLAVVPIDSTAHLGLDISDVLGQEAARELGRTTRGFLDTLETEERRRYMQRPDEANWTIVRESGGWTVRARLGSASEAEASTYADLSLDVELPPEMTLGGDLPPGMWRRVMDRFPEARDAVLAPERRFLVILHDQRLTVHPLTREGIGAATREVGLAGPATVVSIRSSRGAVLRRWRRVIRDAPPPPAR